MYGNCVFWAIKQKVTQGGYIKITKSPNYWYVPRGSWSKDTKTWYCFVPINRVHKPTLLQNLFPIHTLWFKGRVIKLHGT